MFSFFEKRVTVYPQSNPLPLPERFFAFIWACTEGMRGYIVLLTLLSAIIGAFEALLFAMMGHVVDWLANIQPDALWAQEGRSLLWLALVVLGSVAVVVLATMIKHQTLAGNFPMRLRWHFHRVMLEQSMGFYQDEFAGRIATKVMQTALAVRDSCFVVMDILVFVLVYFATVLAIVGNLDRWLLVPFFSWLFLYGMAIRYFVPHLSKVSRNQADARSMMTGRITDAYTNIATVKLFSHAGREASYAKDAMDEFLGTVNAQMRLISMLEVTIHSLSMLLIVGITGTALWLWTQGQVGVGAVAATTAMALRLNGMSHWIMWEAAALFEHVGTVQDGINTLSRRREVADREDAKPLLVSRGEIHFEDICFSYTERNADPDLVINHFSLTVRPGEKIGLVGRSGAGKSTIINLLLHFYDIQSGRILIDGQNIANVAQESLRSQIGMVTQDTALLHRSVRDNIIYGRPQATEAEVYEAARRAQADSFIPDLSDRNGHNGYDAHVGERGVKLSGGQRQRIAIARVMLKNAPILLLDEATSALDSEVETAIQDSLYSLMEGKTVIAIAHRLSTIAAMDRLVVMDQGKIVEEGDHKTLLARGGLYARLWSHQSGGFLHEDDTAAVIECV